MFQIIVIIQAQPFRPQSPQNSSIPMIAQMIMKAPMAIKKIPKSGMAKPAISMSAPSASPTSDPSSCRMAIIVTPNGRSANFFT